MLKDENCSYCVGGELLDQFGIKICDLKVSKLILFKEQSHLGRVIVAYNEHVGDLSLLSDDERNSFFKDVSIAAKVIHELFKPQKINYGAYGDNGNHLHFHLVPKYKGEFEWGTTFEMNPQKKYLNEEKYSELVGMIKNNVKLLFNHTI